MASTRLPGKTLLNLAGRPLLGHVLDRVRASGSVGETVIATTTAPADQEIVDFARANGAPCFCGSVDDVLDRYYRAACQYDADIIVRVTADDPFKDPAVIKLVVSTLLENPRLDYASNTLEPTFPEGLDVEVFTMSALEASWREAALPSERGHVTPYIWKHPDRYRLESVRRSPDLSKLRWTLDYAADYRFASEVYARLYRGQVFGTREILDLLEKEPWLTSINAGIVRNAGYLASLQEDTVDRCR